MDDPAMALVLALSGLLVGAVSALMPVLAVEAYVLTVAATQPTATSLLVALGAAAGQTVGKAVIFTSVRGAQALRGSRWFAPLVGRAVGRAERDAAALTDPGGAAIGAPPRVPAPRRAWSRATRVVESAGRTVARWLSSRRAPWVVVLSGAVGLPPLFALAAAAGLSCMSLRRFAAACLVGRTLRFTALVMVPGAASALL